ncbi:MAG TPA: hypothetical protein VLH19_04670 [Patescibacteria group bacterium]|nr:hypothetical protein [Patescibacteria group bacterium]
MATNEARHGEIFGLNEENDLLAERSGDNMLPSEFVKKFLAFFNLQNAVELHIQMGTTALATTDKDENTKKVPVFITYPNRDLISAEKKSYLSHLYTDCFQALRRNNIRMVDPEHRFRDFYAYVEGNKLQRAVKSLSKKLKRTE